MWNPNSECNGVTVLPRGLDRSDSPAIHLSGISLFARIIYDPQSPQYYGDAHNDVRAGLCVFVRGDYEDSSSSVLTPVARYLVNFTT